MADPLDRCHTAPKFAAPDPDALAQWYQSQLGFPHIAVFENGGYAIVRRGKLALHLWQCPDRHIAENTSCYIELASIAALDALHAEFLHNAQSEEFPPGRIQKAPKDAPGHGMREFHVWDPAGNLMGFGAKLPQAGAQA